MAFDIDKVFESWIIRLLPLWGPFYAVFYITRLLWREWRGRKQQES